MVPADDLARLPFFQGLSPAALVSLASDAEYRAYASHEVVLHQHDRASAVFFLISGAAEFLIHVEGVRELLVGVTREYGAMIGWSVFRAPFRYTATVRCEQPTRLLRVPADAFSTLFERDAACGVRLLHRVAATVASRLESVRDQLLADHQALGLAAEDVGAAPSAPTASPQEWNRAGIAAFLHHSPFFEDIGDEPVEHLAGRVRHECSQVGEVLFVQGGVASEFHVLVEGKVGLYYGEGRGRVFLRSIAGAGDPLGWSALVDPKRYHVTGIALENTRTLAIPSAVLEDYAQTHPRFGVALLRKVLWLVGNRLRATRIRLVARRYHKETLAVRALLEQSAESLHVTSALHKIPYLLEHRVTLSDAFHTLELVQAHGDEVERNVACLALDILTDVRRELRFFEGLQTVYETVVGAPTHANPTEIRRLCVERFVQVFEQTDHIIRGQENLPGTPGHIFIMNHLENHPDNQLPNDFRLTLDSHFVASMILFKKYGEPPIRVVRKPKPDWYGHQQYYDRLDYIYVYAGDVDDEDHDHHISREQRSRRFMEKAQSHLQAGRNVVIAPEGVCAFTEESPRPFRAGAFRLAAWVRPEPLIVPVAVANFDKKITRTRTAAIVFPPFLLSERGVDGNDSEALLAFVRRYGEQFRYYVKQAIALAATGSWPGGTEESKHA